MNRLKLGSAELEIARIDLALQHSAISSPFWKIVFNEIARYRNKVTLSSWRHLLKMLQPTTPLSEEDNPWPYISILWKWRNSVQQCIYNIWLQRICYLKIDLLAGRHKLWVFLCSTIDAQRNLQWYTCISTRGWGPINLKSCISRSSDTATTLCVASRVKKTPRKGLPGSGHATRHVCISHPKGNKICRPITMFLLWKYGNSGALHTVNWSRLSNLSSYSDKKYSVLLLLSNDGWQLGKLLFHTATVKAEGHNIEKRLQICQVHLCTQKHGSSFQGNEWERMNIQ